MMMLPGRTSKIEPFAIDHATIGTGDVDGTTLSDMSVVVNETGRIETIAPSDTIGIPAHYHRIDATGKYVAPGLINAHVHLFSDGRPLDPDRATPRAQKRLKSLLSTPGGRAVATSKARTNLTTLLRSGVTTVRTLGDIGYEAVALRRKVESGALLGPR
ncbi:MAG: amidohydrolase family protein, partial [Bifidobacterium mongoliense]|nr:amidohydrolase family protein [Bifidobacterium mongoliense]